MVTLPFPSHMWQVTKMEGDSFIDVASVRVRSRPFVQFFSTSHHPEPRTVGLDLQSASFSRPFESHFKKKMKCLPAYSERRAISDSLSRLVAQFR